MSSLIQRLRQGPLRSDDYAQVSASRASLRVRIHNLRSRGFKIEAVDIPDSALRRPKVEYHLVGDQTTPCPSCGRV